MMETLRGRFGPINLEATGTRMAIAVGVLALTVVAATAVGLFAGRPAEGGENEVQEFLGGGMGFGSLIALAVALLLGWPILGAVLMTAWPDKRVEVHFWVAIAGLAMAVLHGLGLQGPGDHRGWLSGWLAVLAIALLWITGWRREALVRAWGRKPWRWVHWQLAVPSILLSLEHWMLIEVAK